MLTKYLGTLIIAIIAFSLVQCKDSYGLNKKGHHFPLADLQSFSVVTKKTRKKRNGKLINAPVLNTLYTKSVLSDIPFPVGSNLSIALQEQLKLLKRRKQDKKQRLGNLTITLDQLQETINTLLYWHNNKPGTLLESLDAFQIKGRDEKGNVYFTGYFTPIIKVDAVASEEYAYPIYTSPNEENGINSLPSRVEIDGQGVLKGKGLELAYAKDLTDIYFMQLQGSGIIEYPDGRQEYLSFTGTNGHSYRSIEKYIINNEDIPLKNISMNGIKQFLRENPDLEKPILFANPSYVFFDRKRDRPHGAGHVPLTADYSIAVDTDFIPLGSCLLAALPVMDRNGDFSHHEYKILLAQDIGGAIKGSGRVDIYCGKGKRAQEKAMSFHHYGRLWLLLPKGREKKKLRNLTGSFFF